MNNYLLLSDKPPNRRMLRRGAKLIRIGQYIIAIFITTITLFSILKWTALYILIPWLALFFIYLFLRRFLGRKKHWLMKEKAVIYHGLLVLIAIAGTYLLFRAIGYGIGETDPIGYWMLAVIPLALVSRYGSTNQWEILLLLSLFLLTATRLGSQFTIREGVFVINDFPYVLFPTASQAILLFGISFGIHYAFRYRRMNIVRSRVVTEVSHRLASQVLPEEGYTSAAEAIQKLDMFPDNYFPFVAIMKWDSRDKRLKVVGGAGLKKEQWECVEVEAGQGVTGKSFLKEEAVLEPDVQKLLLPNDYHCPQGFEKTRSELAVPIKYQGQILGVLDVQSQQVDEFDHSDIELLDILASGLGIAFYSTYLMDKKVTSAYELLNDAIDTSDCTEVISWFRKVGESSKNYFSADLLFFFRLAPGTLYPVDPIYRWPEQQPNRVVSIKDHMLDSKFWNFVREQEAIFGLEDMMGYEEILQEDCLGFLLKDQSVNSITLLPIGSDEPLGVLTICYKNSRIFNDIDRLAFLAFSAALERSFRQVHPDHIEEDHRGSTVHDILIPETMGLLGELEDINTSIGDPESIKKHVGVAKDRVISLRKRVTLAVAGLEKRYIPYDESLRNGLHKVASELNANKTKRVAFQINIDDQVENENERVLLLIFRLASEAMGNAVTHGNAQVVKVCINRTAKRIEFLVSDDGTGLPTDHVKHRPHGIYYWKNYLLEEYGIELHLDSQPGEGTSIRFSLPCFPIQVFE